MLTECTEYAAELGSTAISGEVSPFLLLAWSLWPLCYWASVLLGVGVAGNLCYWASFPALEQHGH